MAGSEKKRRWLNSTKKAVLDAAEAIGYQSVSIAHLKNIKFKGSLEKADLMLVLQVHDDVLLHLNYAYQRSLSAELPYVTKKTEEVQKHIMTIARQTELLRTHLPNNNEGYYK